MFKFEWIEIRVNSRIDLTTNIQVIIVLFSILAIESKSAPNLALLGLLGLLVIPLLCLLVVAWRYNM